MAKPSPPRDRVKVFIREALPLLTLRMEKRVKVFITVTPG